MCTKSPQESSTLRVPKRTGVRRADRRTHGRTARGVRTASWDRDRPPCHRAAELEPTGVSRAGRGTSGQRQHTSTAACGDDCTPGLLGRAGRVRLDGQAGTGHRSAREAQACCGRPGARASSHTRTQLQHGHGHGEQSVMGRNVRRRMPAVTRGTLASALPTVLTQTPRGAHPRCERILGGQHNSEGRPASGGTTDTALFGVLTLPLPLRGLTPWNEVSG